MTSHPLAKRIVKRHGLAEPIHLEEIADQEIRKWLEDKVALPLWSPEVRIYVRAIFELSRPEPKVKSDGLDEIFDQHDKKYPSALEWKEAIKGALREWKAGPCSKEPVDDVVKEVLASSPVADKPLPSEAGAGRSFLQCSRCWQNHMTGNNLSCNCTCHITVSGSST